MLFISFTLKTKFKSSKHVTKPNKEVNRTSTFILIKLQCNEIGFLAYEGLTTQTAEVVIKNFT